MRNGGSVKIAADDDCVGIGFREAGHRLFDEDSGDEIFPGRATVDHEQVSHRCLQEKQRL
jgi:hypothetical protein